MTVGLVAFLVGMAVFLAMYGALAPVRTPDPTFDMPDQRDSPEPTGGLFDRIVRPALRNFMPQSPFIAQVSASGRNKVTELLVQSGNPWKLLPEEYLGIQLLFGLAGAAIASFASVFLILPGPTLAWTVGGAVLAAYYPKVKHDGARGRRRKEARRGLPEGIDLLRITLNSGLNFAPAISEVSRRLPDGIIKVEFQRIADDLNAGTALRDAMSSLARRMPSDEVESFCKAIILSERLGADVTDTLASQSKSAREAYEAMLDKKIGALPTTMFFPILGLMLPALFVVILAPALTSIGQAL
jgi:tight adherence protein C